MTITKNHEIDHVTVGINWSREWLLSLGGCSIKTSKTYYVLGSANMKNIGVRIIPRDHHKDNAFEVSTIKLKEYERFKSDFKQHDVDEWYVLIVRTHRMPTIMPTWEYSSVLSYFILLPEALIYHQFVSKAARTINIGYTPAQKQRWSELGAQYSPLFT
ncbi:hypothetical protein B1748_09150 [Paenibacillus sp. MY03]|uniref:hypothetical protein n=1 Tax=Paenibacillus sp. MY03 TaxID=302980 RepID=UPI000B3CD202|nr:hypothetical protein [Paenibacillus sp. MY03]OUS77297.1 hypothetical protein B1748_09150 [Paenibacillus sp. MY03]